MSGHPREHGEERGFWDGGAAGHATNREAAGKTSGYPGVRKPKRLGVWTDIEFPPEWPEQSDEPKWS